MKYKFKEDVRVRKEENTIMSTAKHGIDRVILLYHDIIFDVKTGYCFMYGNYE